MTWSRRGHKTPDGQDTKSAPPRAPLHPLAPEAPPNDDGPGDMSAGAPGASDTCPKCQRSAKPGEGSCGRCGLLVPRWSTFVPSARPGPDDAAIPTALSGAWHALEAAWRGSGAGSGPSSGPPSWDNDAAHERFLDAA